MIALFHRSKIFFSQCRIMLQLVLPWFSFQTSSNKALIEHVILVVLDIILWICCALRIYLSCYDTILLVPETLFNQDST
jgi:hypothetical protein